MYKFKCTVKATVTETYEIEEVFEIDAPDEIQAGEDAISAAENTPLETWLKHPEAHYKYRISDHDLDFEIEDLEEY